jgi:hypothetical protein
MKFVSRHISGVTFFLLSFTILPSARGRDSRRRLTPRTPIPAQPLDGAKELSHSNMNESQGGSRLTEAFAIDTLVLIPDRAETEML